MLSFMLLMPVVIWVQPGMRKYEDEFRQAWLRRFGPPPGGENAPPASYQSESYPTGTYKAWYKQFKKTGIRPEEWLATISGAAPGGTQA